MNDFAKRWVAALRSGEFQQATGCLRYGDGYCCLGVACELYRRETGEGEWDGKNFFLGQHASLPRDIKNALQLRRSDGHFNNKHRLADMNDSGCTFAEIADLIESEPAGLFVEGGEG